MKFLLVAALAVAAMGKSAKNGHKNAHAKTPAPSVSPTPRPTSSPTPYPTSGSSESSQEGADQSQARAGTIQPPWSVPPVDVASVQAWSATGQFQSPQATSQFQSPQATSQFQASQGTGQFQLQAPQAPAQTQSSPVFSGSPSAGSQPLPPYTGVTVVQTQATVEDTSCRNAPVGALWCAAKHKCLRAWEEPCPRFGQDTSTHVQVTNVKTAPVVVPYSPAVVAAASAPVYPPALTPASPQAAQVSPVYQPATQTAQAPVSTSTQPSVGGGRDSYGCSTGGGYSFCTTLNTCIRPWETSCPVALAVAPVATLTPPAPPAIGGQRDAGGCVTGGGYSWCAPLSKCVRPWETPCPAT